MSSSLYLRGAAMLSILHRFESLRQTRGGSEHLPNAGRLFNEPGQAVAATPAVAVPSTGPVHLAAEWETVRRKGTWHVPPSTLVTGSMGTVDMDFTHATFPGPSTILQLQVSITTVKLRIGPDQEIRYGDLQLSGWSKVKDKAGAPTRPGGPVIELTGSASGMNRHRHQTELTHRTVSTGADRSPLRERWAGGLLVLTLNSTVSRVFPDS